MTTLDAALRRAIRQAPCSFRKLAKEAGVSHQMLAAIVAGRERATPRVARLVVAALDAWAARCAKDAAAVRAALGRQTGKEG
jgi:transcriptional regulator with XRE-family HTH domain